MQNNKHYYLINGTVKVSDSKMPVGEYYVSIKPTFFNKTWFESDTKEWLSSLQPCEIDESELEKIKNKVYTFDNCKADNPIDITDIVYSETVRVVCVDCPYVKNSKSPKCQEGYEKSKIIIKFKQPTEKQAESDAVECKHIYEHLDINWITGKIMCNNCHITLEH